VGTRRAAECASAALALGLGAAAAAALVPGWGPGGGGPGAEGAWGAGGAGGAWGAGGVRLAAPLSALSPAMCGGGHLALLAGLAALTRDVLAAPPPRPAGAASAAADPTTPAPPAPPSVELATLRRFYRGVWRLLWLEYLLIPLL